jgi:hypothetical protein
VDIRTSVGEPSPRSGSVHLANQNIFERKKLPLLQQTTDFRYLKIFVLSFSLQGAGATQCSHDLTKIYSEFNLDIGL